MVLIEPKAFSIAMLSLLNWHISQYNDSYTPKWIIHLIPEVLFASNAAKKKDSVKIMLT